jgi:hypothetical protein
MSEALARVRELEENGSDSKGGAVADGSKVEENGFPPVLTGHASSLSPY